jgi:DNA-binding LytR/AlgR family response regulator
MTQKLKCVVVDDDVFIIEMLHELFKHSAYAEITHSFTSPKKFLKAKSSLDFDVCLLDIHMPEMDGLLVAQKLNGKPVIFVTGKDNMLRDALGISPIDILTKPITKPRLESALQKARTILLPDNKNANKEYRLFNVAGSKHKVWLKLSDILLITTDDANNEHKHLFHKDGERHTITDCTLEEFCKCSNLFLQPNKSELVSIDAIYMIVKNRTIVLNKVKENGSAKEVLLSRSYKKAFLAKI